MAYSKDKKETLLQNFDPSTTTIEQYAVENGLSASTFRKWLDIFKKKDASIGNHPRPDFSRKLGKKVDVLNTLQKLVERTDNHRNNEKDYCKIAIKSGKPIAVMKAADFHLGGLDIAYKSLLEHYKFLSQEERFYLQLFGDDLNLMIMHKTVGARHDCLTPEEQCDLLTAMVDDLLNKGKLLSMCWGNHSDEFTERTAGFGLVKLLVSKKVPYFRGMGYIDLQLNDNTYPMAFTHKTRFHSFMNAIHGNKRLEQMHAEYFTANRAIAREYITAHTHYPAVAMEGCEPADRIYYIKCGTYKTDCLYSQRYFGQGRIGVPTVVYFPDRFEHVCFPTPYEAYRFMTGRDWAGLSNSEKK